MSAPVTSLYDFFRKAEIDPVYQDAAIRCYVNHYGFRQEWNIVKNKLDEWAKTNVGGEFGDLDCSRMVDYLNDFIKYPERLP